MDIRPSIMAQRPTSWLGLGRLNLKVNHSCQSLGKDTMCLSWGVDLGTSSRRKVGITYGTNSSWGTLCDNRPAFVSWSSPEQHWHINSLKMMAVLGSVFSNWCTVWNEDPLSCDVALILSFHARSIAVHYTLIARKSVGRLVCDVPKRGQKDESALSPYCSELGLVHCPQGPSRLSI